MSGHEDWIVLSDISDGKTEEHIFTNIQRCMQLLLQGLLKMNNTCWLMEVP